MVTDPHQLFGYCGQALTPIDQPIQSIKAIGIYDLIGILRVYWR
jgi:hypothetical protein